MTVVIDGLGTAETTWRAWLDQRTWPELDLEPATGRRIVVVSAHPDDEVLGVGGLLARLASLGHGIEFVCVTDGEASHPGSKVMTRSQMGARRRDEMARALTALGIDPIGLHHLGYPDGDVSMNREDLRDSLATFIRPEDLVLSPWQNDGHPDHEAVGQIAAELASTCWQFPIWAWHWAGPDDPRIPWSRIHRIPTLHGAAKARAIACFATQILPLGPHPADAPILPPAVVERFIRSDDWVIV